MFHDVNITVNIEIPSKFLSRQDGLHFLEHIDAELNNTVDISFQCFNSLCVFGLRDDDSSYLMGSYEIVTSLLFFPLICLADGRRQLFFCQQFKVHAVTLF